MVGGIHHIFKTATVWKRKLNVPVMTSVRVNINDWRYLCENNKKKEQYSHQYYNDILYVYDLKLMRTDIATINIIIRLKYTIIYSAVGLHIFIC